MSAHGELQCLLAQGENSAVEFAAATASSESIARELVAMANATGGILGLGVTDDGGIEGLDTGRIAL